MAAVVSADVCDVGSLYDAGYKFSFPRDLLEKQLSGVAFDNKTPYTPDEQKRLQEDVRSIWERIVGKDLGKQHAVITAGAPGAGKTLLLRRLLEKEFSGHGYVDPDDVCLKQFRDYQDDIKKDGSPEGRVAAYTKWRPASNAAANLIMGHLILEGRSLAFGSTSSSPVTGKLFGHLKDQKYQLTLIHVTASDDVRWGSIKERDKTFVQTTEQDVRDKGKMVPERIVDTYLKFADTIRFYYRDGVKEDAQLAATWSRSGKTVRIENPSAYEKIKAIHDSSVRKDHPELLWESTVEKG